MNERLLKSTVLYIIHRYGHSVLINGVKIKTLIGKENYLLFYKDDLLIMSIMVEEGFTRLEFVEIKIYDQTAVENWLVCYKLGMEDVAHAGKREATWNLL